jgi:hypothetical protein
MQLEQTFANLGIFCSFIYLFYLFTLLLIYLFIYVFIYLFIYYFIYLFFLYLGSNEKYLLHSVLVHDGKGDRTQQTNKQSNHKYINK